MKKLSLTLALTLMLATNQAKAEDTITNLTIYGNSPQSWNMPIYYSQNVTMPGYGIISFARQVGLNSGINTIAVANVPDEIDPSSIMIKNIGRNIEVVEQNFSSSKSNSEDIIKKNIGREIEVEKYSGDGVITTKGVLLDSSSGLILKDGDKIKILNDYSAVTLPDGDNSSVGNMIKWVINSGVSGDSVFEYSYKTQGISWYANYNVYLDGSGKDIMAKIEGWANLLNNTNINVKDTNLKLVAGEVAQDQQQQYYGGRAMVMEGKAMAMDAAAPSMHQEKFSEYHMYTIDRKINLPAQSTKKIRLFDNKDGVLAIKKYLFDGGMSGDNGVKAVITFKNDQKSRLGIPLPGGKYRVYSKDSTGAYEQVGETTEEHKAENEEVKLTIGNTFDLKAERRQVDNEQDQLRRRGKYTVTVEITNALEEEVDVMVKEPMYQQNWQILSATNEYKKENANTVEFKVPTAPKGRTVLEYVVQYSW